MAQPITTPSSRRHSCGLSLGLTLALSLGLELTGALACAPAETKELPPAQQTPRQTQGYSEHLTEIDITLEDARALAEQRDGWADHELVAQLLVRRARLTGSIDDWAEADQALVAAFAVAPAGGGPILTRLELDLSLHRLDQAAAHIALIEAAPLRTGAIELRLATARGELAAQHGDLDTARHAFDRAHTLGAAPSSTAGRLGLLARRRGDYEAARLAFASAWGHGPPSGQSAAWLLLQEGLVEWSQARPAAALAKYEAAEDTFPGWWLVREHRAEALAALGRSDEAESIYREVIAQTGHPDLMDALGELLRTLGHEAEARQWTSAARSEHERRIVLLPRAAGAHALDHLIRFAPHEPRTLELARELARLAPHEDNLRRLATAALTTGDIEAADDAIERALAHGARSRELDELAGEIERARAEKE